MNGKNLFTLIPKVDELLNNEIISELLDIMPRKIIMDSIRDEIDKLRTLIKEGSISEDEIKLNIDNLANTIKLKAVNKNVYSLKQVVNATGTVIHTNLGRSVMNEEIFNNMKNIALNYSNLEYELESGTRGSRYSHVEEIIKELIGGEASMVVNNNAAAVLLALSAMVKDKEVIVSRGELIEIGGSFRIPEVLEQSGAKLISVGSTNKTHLYDYENAINENTGALLKVHTSNYRILGFTAAVDSKELYELKEKYGIPLIEDLGSGVLIDLSAYGLEYEPTVGESLAKGVDVVTFSGDKLLGGPQAGIIIGKKEYIDKMKKHPLTRAFRVDKFTISALEATLKYYLDEKKAVQSIPTLRMLTIPLEEINIKANDLLNKIKSEIKTDTIELEILDDFSEVGGGSLPLEQLPTKCIVLTILNSSTQQFENMLRDLKIPIITRLYRDKIYLDLRTIKEGDYDIIVSGISSVLQRLKELQ